MNVIDLAKSVSDFAIVGEGNVSVRKDNNLLIFVLTCLKLIFCFLVSGILLMLMIKLKIVEKKMVAESYIAPIKNFIK